MLDTSNNTQRDDDSIQSSETLHHLLGAIRSHLDMDVAFISEFSQDKRVFRLVNAKGEHAPIRVGDADPLSETYCQRVADGRLPQLIPDTSLVAETSEVSATESLPVGAHISVPIRLDDGELYGTICCFSYEPDPGIRERDLSILRLLSDFAGKEISRDLVPVRAKEDIKNRIHTILTSDLVNMVYQPIYHLQEQRTVGFESLARFPSELYRSPDICFNEAVTVGLSEELEMRALAKSLSNLNRLPMDIYLTLNTSPEHLLSGAIDRILDGVPEDRIVIEVTEHAHVSDYAELCKAINRLRGKGIGFAVDDAGAGYASFRHILELNPEIIKLDMKLTRDIHKDKRRYALAAGLIGFAHASGSHIIAEGVECIEELTELRKLGVTHVQGYFVGRPAHISDVGDFLNGYKI